MIRTDDQQMEFDKNRSNSRGTTARHMTSSCKQPSPPELHEDLKQTVSNGIAMWFRPNGDPAAFIPGTQLLILDSSGTKGMVAAIPVPKT